MALTEDIVTRIRADPTEFEAGIGRAEQATKRLTTTVDQGTRQQSAGYRGASRAALSAANAIGSFTGTQNKALIAMQMVTFQAATMSNALSRTGGAIGTVAMGLTRALPILAVVGAAITVAVTVWNALTGAKEKNRAETEKTIDAKQRLTRELTREQTALQGVAKVEVERFAELVGKGMPVLQALAQAQREGRAIQREALALSKEGLPSEMALTAALARRAMAAEAVAEADKKRAEAARKAAEAASPEAQRKRQQELMQLAAAAAAPGQATAADPFAEETRQQAEAQKKREAIAEKERAVWARQRADMETVRQARIALVRAEVSSTLQAVAALSIQAALAKKSFSDWARAIAELMVMKATMHAVEAAALYVLAAWSMNPKLAAEAVGHTKAAVIYAGFAASLGFAGGGIGSSGGGAGLAVPLGGGGSPTALFRGGGGAGGDRGGGGGEPRVTQNIYLIQAPRGSRGALLQELREERRGEDLLSDEERL